MAPDFQFFLSIFALFLCQNCCYLTLYSFFPSWGCSLSPPPWELPPIHVNDVGLCFFFFLQCPIATLPGPKHPHSSHPVCPDTSGFSGAYALQVIICAAVSAAAQIHLRAWLSTQPKFYTDSCLDLRCSTPCPHVPTHFKTEPNHQKPSSAHFSPAIAQVLVGFRSGSAS